MESKHKHQKQQQVSGEEMEQEPGAQAEVDVFGVGVGAVSTPSRSKKRDRSGGTPTGSPEFAKVWRSELNQEVITAIEEMRNYLGANFAPKHSKYFEKRFTAIMEAQVKLEEDNRRNEHITERIRQVEKSLKTLRELDWGKEVVRVVREEVEELGRSLAQGILRSNQEVLDKIRKEVDGALDTITAHDAERGKEIEKVTGEVKEGFMKVSKGITQVSRECETSRKFMEEVRSNLDRVYERVGSVHAAVDPLEMNVLREVNRRLDSMDVERIGEKMVSAVESVARKVEGVKGVERMDVDEQKGSDWASVVRRNRRGPRVIVEVPGAKEFQEKKSEVIKCLDPKKGEVRVKGVTRRGKDVVVEVLDKNDVAKLNENECLRERGMKVKGVQGWRSPRVKIFDVAAEIGRNELLECVKRRNSEVFAGMSEEEVQMGFVPEFSFARRGEWCEWVVRVSASVFTRLMMCGRLFVGVRACRLVEFLGVRKCGKCHRFGHSGARCDAPTVCGFCGTEGHHEARCEVRAQQDKVKCINCVRYGFKDHSHPVNWSECPVAVLQRKMLANNTSYEAS